MKLSMTRRVVLTAASALMFSTAMAAVSQAQTSLSFLVDNADASVKWAEQLVADFEALNPDIKITIETRPGGTDGDNIVKTRLATGEMTDIFNYNAGSLFQAINPIQNIVDLNDEPWKDDVLTSFQSVVTATDGHVYGAPFGAAMGGGVLYNKKIYADLGLSVPRTGRRSWPTTRRSRQPARPASSSRSPIAGPRSCSSLVTIFNVQAAVPNFAETTPPTRSSTRRPRRRCAASSTARKCSTPAFLNADASALRPR